MLKRFLCHMATAALPVLVMGCGETYSGPPADLVVKNAEIVTIDKENPRAEAVAVIGEEIIAVTSNAEVEQYIEEGRTKVIDAAGRLLIPGFNDAHAHFGALDPDYIVILEVYGRLGLLPHPDFQARYRLLEKLEADIYGSDGMLIFARQ